MLHRIYNFEQLDIFHTFAKILSDHERDYIVTLYPISSMRTISVDEIICIEVGAKEGDIIYIRNNKTDKYLYVVGRYPLL